MSVEFDQSRLTVVDHPMVQHKLTIMRDVKTGSKQFRELVSNFSLKNYLIREKSSGTYRHNRCYMELGITKKVTTARHGYRSLNVS